MRRIFIIAVTYTVFTSAAFAQDKTVGIATFNLAWAGSVQDFERHVEFCNAANWCDTRLKNDDPADEPRAKQCAAKFEAAAGGAAAGLLVAPCNAYKLNERINGQTATIEIETVRPEYDEKIQQLTATVLQLITAKKIDIFAFEEVRSKEVIEKILGVQSADFGICIAPHTGFQTVAIAYRKSLSLKPANCVPEQRLAVKEKLDDAADLKYVRPGLALHLQTAAGPLAILAIHLKSSCASPGPGGYRPHKISDMERNCRVLNRQVEPLETWLDTTLAGTPRVVLLGDFNRKLDEEEAANPDRSKVRSNGSAPDSVNATDKDGYVKTSYLWQEIADGVPVPVHRVAEATKVTGCSRNEGLDHIVISNAVMTAQKSRPVAERIAPLLPKKGKILTSDHCPLFVRLQL